MKELHFEVHHISSSIWYTFIQMCEFSFVQHVMPSGRLYAIGLDRDRDDSYDDRNKNRVHQYQ